jgi:choline dehydrogenase-like flavoprotein
MGVPVHQVKEFSPAISFGCSISSRPFLAVGMLDHPDDFAEVLRRWEQAAVYYAMISPRGTGMVRSRPGFRDPQVRYRLEKEDRRALADGLRNLCRLLLEAGAERLYGSIRGSASIKGSADLDGLPAEVPAGDTGLMTIHLFSSVPMGENRSQCGADSFGRMFDLPNLHVNDASLLCGAPGVNPQGTIMAIARRNTLKFLGKLN